MKRKWFLSLLYSSLITLPVFAQEKSPARFGRVSVEDFKKANLYTIDSDASAVIIADIGSTEVVGNTKGWFSLEFKNYRRAFIRSKNGYDIGNVEISISTNGDLEEQLINLRAVTYNLENDRVVETKLETKTAVFTDRINKNLVIKKFTFPNIREGSIIEYQYTLKSDWIVHLPPWEFQGRYPRLWSEYKLTAPDFFNYVNLSQGYRPYDIKTQKGRSANFNISDSRGSGSSGGDNFTAGVTDYRWVMKTVPSLKEENFVSTLRNHICRIEFQLAEYRYPLPQRNVIGTWAEASEVLLEEEDFGYSLTRDNPWLNDVMEAAVNKASNDLDKAKNIYRYVRDNTTCTNYNRMYLEQPLKNVLKTRSGNVGEINLLLVAMLRKSGLNADPVMLSTRSNGYTYAAYPLIDRFNYVIARTIIDRHTYYLDASDPWMGFGRLGYQCYNGHARVIDAEATRVDFSPDSLLEKKVTSVFVINDEEGNLAGTVQDAPGYFESYNLRAKVRGKGMDQLGSDIRKRFTNETAISNLVLDSLYNLEEPVILKYNFKTPLQGDDMIYLNPLFGNGYPENPFKSAERFYPVEMPFAMDETYILQMQVPHGYVLDELPKETVVSLNANNDGIFEYRVSEANGTLSIRSRLRIKRTFFLPDEYKVLREFFNIVVKKHSEQVVFKKKQ